MSHGLTARQREILDYIALFIKENQYAPTLREIGAAMNIASTNGVNDHLEALRRKGYLMQPPLGLKNRTIRMSARAKALYEDFSRTTMAIKLDSVQRFIDEFPGNSSPDFENMCTTSRDGAQYVLEILRKILYDAY